ncbi:taste receptor type 2 member 40-like [Latimeria chalumnae]|uniref:taste receptor type 2 member 40-like n=1 Tax=Latimeria chalumnae TaxID=7897 RepID=UPI00313E9C32
MEVSDIMLLSMGVLIVWFGCIWNTFIILVLILEYRRSRSLQLYEVIVMLISICSLILEVASICWFFVFFLNLCLSVGELFFQVTDTTLLFLPKVVIWLTAWLCFIYCVKIIKVSWGFFLRLKQKISLVVKIMATGTVVMCFVISLPTIFIINFRPNTTEVCRKYHMIANNTEMNMIYSTVISFFTSFMPLILMLLSCFSIMIFLYQHSRNMDKNIKSSSSSRNEAHTAVAIMLFSLTALFIVCAGAALPINIQIALGQYSAKMT